MAGRESEAVERFQEALPIRREVGDRYGEMITLANLGDTLHDTGHVHQAHACWRAAMEVSEELTDPGTDGLRTKLETCGCSGPAGERGADPRSAR